MLRCRARLLPSGSKERFWFARRVFLIPVIRGAQLFAPYQRIGLWAARPPAPRQPARPLLCDDPDHIRQVAAAFSAALLNREQAEPRGFPKGVLNHPAADPGSRGELVYAPVAMPVLANFVADNPQHRQLTDRELAGQRGRHRTRGGEVATTCNRHRALGGALQPPRWEDRRPPERNANWLDLAS